MELLHGRNAQNLTLSKFVSFSLSKIQDGSHCKTEFNVESYGKIFKIRNVFLENAKPFKRKLDMNVPWMSSTKCVILYQQKIPDGHHIMTIF